MTAPDDDWDILADSGRLAATHQQVLSEHVLSCPECGADVPVSVVEPSTQGERCDAPFPDAQDRRCELEPHAADEHDPEHETTGAGGSRLRWRASEVQT